MYVLEFNLQKNRFHESPTGLVPKKDVEPAELFEDVGFAVGYSVLHGGPNFPLASHVYKQLTGDEVTDDALSLEDLPQNGYYQKARELIQSLRNLVTEEEVVSFYAAEENQSQLAAFGWSLEFHLSLDVIGEAVQTILRRELLLTPKPKIEYLKKGLYSSKLLPMIQKFPSQMKEVFEAGEDVTGEVLLSLCVVDDVDFSDNEEKVRAFGFFKRYVGEQWEKKIFVLGSESPQRMSNSILQFATGCKVLPAYGLHSMIKVNFLMNDNEFPYPTSEACVQLLKLPTVHMFYRRFAERMEVAMRKGMSFQNE